MIIQSKEISVVVQGAISGRAGDPPKSQLTRRCIASIRRHLPDAELILSTWEGSDTADLDFDRLVENEDPGACPLDVDRKVMNNVNRQIVSTRGGLCIADRKYAIKIRSDFEMTGTAFLKLFSRYQARADECRILRDRLVASTVFSINARRFAPMPFHPSDWFFFGNRDDLFDLWDIPLAPEPETSRWYDTRPKPSVPFLKDRTARYAPEQTIWLGFLTKYMEVPCEFMTDLTDDSARLSELSMVNNLVMATPEQLQIKYLKGRRGAPWDRDRMAVYTHGEWLALYRKYCDASARSLRFDPRSWFNRYCYMWFWCYSRLFHRNGDAKNRRDETSLQAIRPADR